MSTWTDLDFGVAFRELLRATPSGSSGPVLAREFGGYRVTVTLVDGRRFRRTLSAFGPDPVAAMEDLAGQLGAVAVS